MGNSKGMQNTKKLKFHYTYQTKNLNNGTTYVGRHSTNNLEDGYIGSGKLLRRAIKKHGKENFVCTILSFFDSYEEAVEEEEFLVTKEYCERGDNYNIVVGGSNPRMYGALNPSWKGGISKDPNYRIKGVPHDFTGTNNPMYGRKQSKEAIEKNKLNQKTRVEIEVDGVIYPCIKDAARAHNVSYDTAMRRACVDTSFPNWRCLNAEAKALRLKLEQRRAQKHKEEYIRRKPGKRGKGKKS